MWFQTVPPEMKQQFRIFLILDLRFQPIFCFLVIPSDNYRVFHFVFFKCYLGAFVIDIEYCLTSNETFSAENDLMKPISASLHYRIHWAYQIIASNSPGIVFGYL
jgi:hypothetical protein